MKIKKVLKTSLVGIVGMGIWYFTSTIAYMAPIDNLTLAESLRSYSTIRSIGIEWDITGDANHNATASIKYRVQGSEVWKDGLPLYRIDLNEYNMFSGSILFLNPDTVYEVMINVSDPDRGRNDKTLTVATRPIPAMPVSGNTYHVMPGISGGDGSEANPFQGFNTAKAVALPGDIFLLHAGIYGGDSSDGQGRLRFDVSGEPGNYIVWKAFGDGAAILNKGVRIAADYIWLDGLTVTAGPIYRTYGSYGLVTGTHSGVKVPTDVVLNRNSFIGNTNSIVLNSGGQDWYIVDNTIVGDNLDPTISNFGGEGIELYHSDGHTVAYNTISYVGDGISYPGNNVDIFGNDIFNTTDDGIEPDYAHNNIRIWKNRITEVKNNGISFQDVLGGPWYIIYNQVTPRAGGHPFKNKDAYISGTLIAHNTLVARAVHGTNWADQLLGVQSNNNLWIYANSKEYARWSYIWYVGAGIGGRADWRTNVDYDGFDYTNTYAPFSWTFNGRKTVFSDFASFFAATGLEEHGIRVEKADTFETFDVPEDVGLARLDQFMTLKANANSIDAGIALPNINDGYNGSAPDLGAYEYGAELPHYGVRTTTSSNEREVTPLVSPQPKQEIASPTPIIITNQPPVITTSQDSYTVEIGETLNILITATDKDSNNITIDANIADFPGAKFQ